MAFFPLHAHLSSVQRHFKWTQHKQIEFKKGRLWLWEDSMSWVFVVLTFERNTRLTFVWQKVSQAWEVKGRQIVWHSVLLAFKQTSRVKWIWLLCRTHRSKSCFFLCPCHLWPLRWPVALWTAVIHADKYVISYHPWTQPKVPKALLWCCWWRWVGDFYFVLLICIIDVLHSDSSTECRKWSTAPQKHHAPSSSSGCDSMFSSGQEQNGVSPLLPPQTPPPVPAHSPQTRPRSTLTPPARLLLLLLPLLLWSDVGAEPAPARSGLVICHGRDSVV